MMTLNTEETPLPVTLEENLKEGQTSSQIENIMQNARRASEILKALGHETRLLLVCLLSERERSVTELENILSLRQPTVSQQLARLRLDGLVTARREGKAIYYRLDGTNIEGVVSAIHNIFRQGQSGNARDARFNGHDS